MAATIVVEQADKEELTFEKLKQDLDAGHLEGISIANILRILVEYLPALGKFKKDVDNLQHLKYAKCRMQATKMEYHPLECTGFVISIQLRTSAPVLDLHLLLQNSTSSTTTSPCWLLRAHSTSGSMLDTGLGSAPRIAVAGRYRLRWP
ncbi:uncharacterized protein EI90DRAFT_3131525 [Cantharellus anzutake]|uniref:uncharacterized protein n=1 Tax=Cantharellus anzutake TaxID=1750568 RepID=UPI001904E0AA|nr:uncharacterized protein EI90DRAFT_3131525 [Cantharellus anzutake]KAF8321865.1 hypothetical protein EI90DRAFT_3131525 [Cantharellus anzutake]